MISLADRSIVHLLHRASQIAENGFTIGIGKDDLTVRQVILLAAVSENEGANQTIIGKKTGIDRSTLANMVQRLVKRGLVARRRKKKDSRAYALKLTEAGEHTLATSLPILETVEVDLLARLSIKQKRDLAEILTRLLEPTT